jgi:monofunctional biosynthetic peptidoglycan transglycosylase
VVIAGVLLLTVLPAILVLPWRWIDPPTSSFISQARATGLDIQQEWVDWAEISPQAPIAVVAAEDQNFPHHHGFDFTSIQSALMEEGERRRGASTISQQVVKNLFLWPGPSWLRKGLEAYLTGFVELLWPKRRILEIYLNIAEFGPGVFGVEASARRFFGRSASSLTARQAATLAAVLPSPRRLSAAEPSRYVEERVAWILRQMKQLGGPEFLAGI